MRLKATVVGKTLIVDSDVGLPEGARAEVVLRAFDDNNPTWDVSDEDWAELQASVDEAETSEGIPAETALAELRAMKELCKSSSCRGRWLDFISRPRGGCFVMHIGPRKVTRFIACTRPAPALRRAGLTPTL